MLDALSEGLGDAIVRSAPEAIVCVDRDGLIRFWNPGAERIFGFSAAEALGGPLDAIIPEPLRARHWAGFRRVMATGASRYGAGDLLAVPGLRRDGARISLEFTIALLRDGRGRVVGMAAIMRDVTARFEETKRLRRRLVALEQAGGANRSDDP